MKSMNVSMFIFIVYIEGTRLTISPYILIYITVPGVSFKNNFQSLFPMHNYIKEIEYTDILT